MDQIEDRRLPPESPEYDYLDDEVNDMTPAQLFKELEDFGIDFPETTTIKECRERLVEKKIDIIENSEPDPDEGRDE